MSLDSWKAEFYKQLPEEIKTEEEAIAHSILKWKGLTEWNLTRHGLIASGGEISEGENGKGSLLINYKSCALCHLYLKGGGNTITCGRCPIFKKYGIPCDSDGDDVDDLGCEFWKELGIELDGYDSPFHDFTHEDNPAAMIAVLESLLEDK